MDDQDMSLAMSLFVVNMTSVSDDKILKYALSSYAKACVFYRLVKYTDEDGKSLLWYGCLHGRTQLVKVIARLCPKEMLIKPDTVFHMSPIICAIARHHDSIAKYLIDSIDLSEYRYAPDTHPFIYACSRGHAHIVEHMLRRGQSVDCEDSQHRDPLLCACICGEVNTVRLLLRHVAPNRANRHGITALQCAAKLGHLDVLRELTPFYSQEEIDAPNAQGLTAAMLAAREGCAEVVAELIDAGGAASQDLLLYSILVGRRDTVEVLLSRGAQPTGPAVLYAVVEGHVGILHALIIAGASLGPVAGHELVDLAQKQPEIRRCLELYGHHEPSDMLGMARSGVRFSFGQTVLHGACLIGDVDMVKQLVTEEGIDANGEVDSRGLGALHYACKGEHCTSELVHFLVDAGVDVDGGDRCAITPLHVAMVEQRTAAIAAALLERGADVARMCPCDMGPGTPKAWYTCMHVACGNRVCAPELIAMLAKRRSGLLDSKSEDTETPLCPLGIASMIGSDAAVDALLAHGAVLSEDAVLGATDRMFGIMLRRRCNAVACAVIGGILQNLVTVAKARECLNLTDAIGRTVLHAACQVKDVEMIRAILADQRCAVNVVTQHGITPLLSAIESVEIVRLLLDHGALPDYPKQAPSGGALHRACQKRAPQEVVRALLDRGADTHRTDHRGRTPADLESRPEVRRMFL